MSAKDLEDALSRNPLLPKKERDRILNEHLGQAKTISNMFPIKGEDDGPKTR